LSDARRGIAVAALSGVLSYAVCFLVEGAGVRWGAGIVFGLLVLGPSQRRAGRFAGLAMLSIAVYRAAVWIAQQLHTEGGVAAVLACALAGAAGAVVLALGTAAIGKTPAALRATALGAVLGAASGALIGFAVDLPEGSLALHPLVFAGYVGWQVGYLVSHELPSWSPTRA
jgi:hypothetical protein